MATKPLHPASLPHFIAFLLLYSCSKAYMPPGDKWAKRRRDQNKFTSSHKRKNRKKFAEQCTVALLEIQQQSADCWMSNMTCQSCMWDFTSGYQHRRHQVEGMEDKNLTFPEEQGTSWENPERFSSDLHVVSWLHRPTITWRPHCHMCSTMS